MARIAVLVAQKVNGEWATLALPDTSIQDQKDMIKSIKEKDGLVGEEVYQKAVLLSSSGQVKRYRMKGKEPNAPRGGMVQVPAGKDGLGAHPVSRLIEIVEKEGLNVKLPEKPGLRNITKKADSEANAKAIKLYEAAVAKVDPVKLVAQIRKARLVREQDVEPEIVDLTEDSDGEESEVVDSTKNPDGKKPTKSKGK